MSRLSQAFWFLEIPPEKETGPIANENRLRMIYPKWHMTDLDYENHKFFLSEVRKERRRNIKKKTKEDQEYKNKKV